MIRICMKFSKILLARDQIWPDGWGWGLPYSNVYIFTDWIFSWTDTSPRATTVKSATIYGAYYDRRENVIWLYTSNWVWWYDFDTDNITVIDNYTRNSIWWDFALYWEYIVVHCNTYAMVVDRSTKTKLRTISRPGWDYDYTWINFSSPYNQNSKYIVSWQWYAYKNVVDITTWTTVGSYWTSYYQAYTFNDKFFRYAENVNSWIYIADVTSSWIWSATTITSSWYWKANSTRETDSWLINKVTSNDMEYNLFYVWAARTTQWYYLIDASTKTAVKAITSWTPGISWKLIKYNNDWAISWGNGNQNDSNWSKIWKISRSTKDATVLAQNINSWASGNWNDHLNITSSWNICVWWVGIYNFSWTRIYTNSSFITGFSKTVF